MRSSTRSYGFTMVEIMIVITIIGILAAAVMFSISSAKNSSRISKTKSDLADIKLAMQLYREEVGTMPSGGNVTFLASRVAWKTVTVPEITSQVGVTMPLSDQWGWTFAYDNNYLVPTAQHPGRPSIVCSLGPDQTLQTWAGVNQAESDLAANNQRVAQGDDICIFFTENDDT